jgi:hypothetical protein
MAKGEFGFVHSAPPPYKDSWTRTIEGETFTYTIEQREDGGYDYSCCCGSATVHAQTTGKREQDEVERLPRFIEFVSLYRKGFVHESSGQAFSDLQSS